MISNIIEVMWARTTIISYLEINEKSVCEKVNPIATKIMITTQVRTCGKM